METGEKRLHGAALPVPSEPVRQAYLRARGEWTGCDWPTAFGHTRLDLKGITSAQALLMARATSGPEAADWREAVYWLHMVEADAAAAESSARQAAAATDRGDLSDALTHARRAYEIESRYHAVLVWEPFWLTLQAAASSR